MGFGGSPDYTRRSLEGFCTEDEGDTKNVFKSFGLVLGPVGAAKGLHLLAPRFFLLWDRTIAQKYRLRMWPRGYNAERYCRFMGITKRQIKLVGGEQAIERVMGRNALKAHDKHNYCKAKGSTEYAVIVRRTSSWRLSKDKTTLCVNPPLTLDNIPRGALPLPSR
ncbi:MAG: hypothetical protein ACJ8FY_05265 [Gemmataceae bacterium]